MPTIVFEADGAEPLVVDEPDGGRLVDVCDDVSAPVPFSCRGASCATCVVRVLEGADLLDPPDVDEADMLAILGSPPEERLACAAVVGKRPGVLRLRAVNVAPP